MIKSMTAFGMNRSVVNSQSVTVEIRCVNHRYQDITVRVPGYLMLFEDQIRKLVAARIPRGMVEATVTVRNDEESNIGLRLNLKLAESYLTLANRIKDAFAINEPVPFSAVLGCDGVIAFEALEFSGDSLWPQVEAGIIKALDAVSNMKLIEGENLRIDLVERLAFMERRIDIIKERSSGLAELHYKKLKERISRMSKDVCALDENRLIQEVAYIADKSDVTEELVRLGSHISQFYSAIDSEGALGRRLNFLAQELNREINTIGSKISDADLTQVVVDLKCELEKIREQVQNIE
ncbi:MAG: YicC/YloC family endoribonuclease [Pseudomonadota bacterium]